MKKNEYLDVTEIKLFETSYEDIKGEVIGYSENRIMSDHRQIRD